MLKSCQDNFYTTFGTYPIMEDYHEHLSDESQWVHCKVNELTVEPLDKTAALYGNPSAFASGTSMEAIEDTADHLGLAIRVNGNCYPVRDTAYKSLLDSAFGRRFLSSAEKNWQMS